MSRLIDEHTFRGLTYSIRVSEDVDGSCCVRKNYMPMLAIMKKLNTKKGLETAIHEGLHACGLYSEADVNPTAKDIADFLWKLGFRKVK